MILATGVADDPASLPHPIGDWPWIDFCHQYLVCPLVPIGETVGAMSALVRTGSLKE
jgi:hypothetical protein